MPWMVLRLLWLGKLAAFEANQLQRVVVAALPAASGLQLIDALREVQIQAHPNPYSVVPANDMSASHSIIDFKPCSPDKDIVSTGACLLVEHEDSGCIYDADGRFISDIHG